MASAGRRGGARCSSPHAPGRPRRRGFPAARPASPPPGGDGRAQGARSGRAGSPPPSVPGSDLLGQLVTAGIPVALVLGRVDPTRLGEDLPGELLVGANRRIG